MNDFPTAHDKAIKRSGPLFDKILKEKKIIYMAAGPSADFDRDGRLDLFLANWWLESRSLLLRNVTPGGNWLDVRVEGREGVNRMGVGARVNIYPAGKQGEASALLGSREIGIGYGVTVHGVNALVFKGLMRPWPGFRTENAPSVPQNPLFSGLSPRERLPARSMPGT